MAVYFSILPHPLLQGVPSLVTPSLHRPLPWPFFTFNDTHQAFDLILVREREGERERERERERECMCAYVCIFGCHCLGGVSL